MAPESFIEVPASENILHFTADFTLNNFAELVPDLSSICVILPHTRACKQFQHALLQSLTDAQPAIIPPWCGTLGDWVQQFTDSAFPERDIVSQASRQLLFIDALQQYPDLFREDNQWQVATALLSLFDDLNLSQHNFFQSQEELSAHLKTNYGITDEHAIDLEHLNLESKLVFTLWQAWKLQLEQNALIDETQDYLSRLSDSSLHRQTTSQYFICLGSNTGHASEKAFVERLSAEGRCTLIDYASTLHKTTDSTSCEHPFTDFIQQTFAQSDIPFKRRATNFAEKHQHSAESAFPLSCYLASTEESQVRAIDYYIRMRLLEGKTNIAIISEDRKLSRRLRALLERADVPLQDNAGWSLATTQAATVIERWLECIEEDFSAYPFLDCLKSPFIDITHLFDSEADTGYFRQQVYRFEQDIIFHENVGSNIASYKSTMKRRLDRLQNWPERSYADLNATLDLIADIAAPLITLHTAGDKIKLSTFIDTLITSLQRLGVMEKYRDDDAGLLLLESFEQLRQSTQQADPALNWQDCRIWLGMALESQHFIPRTANANVQLMTLEQSRYMSFDCVVIASCEPKHYPGSAECQPLFNQSVRASLQLPVWEQRREHKHEMFNQLLLSSSEVLLTACDEEKGEPKPVSQWLELLQQFYTQSYGGSFEDRNLRRLVEAGIEIHPQTQSELPQQRVRPAPSLPVARLPDRVSASSYQRLIDCPYQFFAADGLELKPREDLSDELKKSDYGERIHLILQCFHSGHDYFGEAFTEKITPENWHRAESHLVSISEAVFLRDLEDNVLHRSWLYRWKKHIPAYLDWQMKQQQEWDIYRCENRIDIDLEDGALQLTGRLDRIDSNTGDASHMIIDYKTGRTAEQEDVDIGENVQLSTYALLDPQASYVSYLSVDSSDQKVETKAQLSGDELYSNRDENRRRLVTMFDQLRQHKDMTAWGDETVCRYCRFSGLCRKAEWAP